jgi:hypothetical protein
MWFVVSVPELCSSWRIKVILALYRTDMAVHKKQVVSL